METINHEYYISLEVAQLLKQAGFDWRCRKCYNNGVLFDMESDEIREQCPQHSSYDVLVPTLDVAQRWLREVKSIYIEITVIENKRAVTNSDGWTFHYEYDKPTFDWDIKDERCENMCTLYDSFDTYEEAQEAGIKKALETI